MLTVEGELDHHTLEILNEVIRDILDGGCYRLILDLSKVNYVSSGGVGVLIGTLAEVRSNQGDLVLLSPHPAVLDVLETLGLISELTTANDFNAALRAFPDCTVACPEPQA